SGDDLLVANLDGLVLRDLVSRQPQEVSRCEAVAGQVPVQRARWSISRLAIVEDDDRPPAAAQHQRGAQSGGAGADHDDVMFRLVGHVGRLGQLPASCLYLACNAARASKRGSDRSESTSGSRRTRAAVSAGSFAATRSSESRARSRSPLSAYMHAT